MDLEWLSAYISERLGLRATPEQLASVLDAMAERGEVRAPSDGAQWFFKHGTVDERVKAVLSHLSTPAGRREIPQITGD